MTDKKTKLLQFIIIVLLFSLFSFPVDTAKAITISPLNFELNANPGDSIANIVRVYNDSDGKISINMEIKDFVATGEEGRVFVKNIEDSDVYSLAKWVALTPQTFTLAPRSSQKVEFIVNVPADGEPGGHYASILASLSGSASAGEVGVSQKVGSLILLNMAGDVVEKIEVVEFSAPEFTEYGPKELTVRFSNLGTVHLKPRGFVHIKNMLGQEVAKIDLPQMNVLPQSVRKIAIPVDLKNQIGKYEATLVAIYGSTNEPISAVTEYWVVPWKEITIILVIIIVVLILLFLSRKRLKLAAKILFKGERHVMKNLPKS